MLSKRWAGRGAAVLGGISLVLTVALVWGEAAPAWLSRGRFAVGVCGGDLEISRCTVPINRVAQGWIVRAPQVNALIKFAPASRWRPNTTSGAVSVAGVSGTVFSYTVRVAFIPLWPWALSSAGLTGLLWWRWRGAVLPMHCHRCGYSLAGLGGPRCPECGEPAPGVISRLVALWARARTPGVAAGG